MKYGDKISTYNVKFLRYSGQLDWGDSVFAHQYYKGLPNRLQDQISLREAGKPGTFQEMMRVATAYDDRHWERECEKEYAHTHSNQPATSSNKSCKGQQQQQQQQNNPHLSNNPQSSGNKPNNPSSTSNNNNNNSHLLPHNPAPPSSTAPSNTASSSSSSS